MKAFLTFKDGYFEVTGPTVFLMPLQWFMEQRDLNFKDHCIYLQLHYHQMKSWFVECAVSHKQIALADLCYWDADNQVAFFGIEEALEFAEKQPSWAYKRVNSLPKTTVGS